MWEEMCVMRKRQRVLCSSGCHDVYGILKVYYNTIEIKLRYTWALQARISSDIYKHSYIHVHYTCIHKCII